MKTTIELNGFEIVITELEGSIVVSAVKEDETVEEFTLEVDSNDEVDTQEGDDIIPFEAQEEDDFGAEAQDADDDDDDDDEQGMKLESFTSFIEKRK